MRDKAKVLLTVLFALSALYGCASPHKPQQEGLRLSDPLVVASVLSMTENEPSDTQDLSEMPRIKIVSGDGMPLSAKKLSRELAGRGYKIDRVDVAPFTFKEATVFYAPGYDSDARELAGIIKARGGIKPLTWKSIYDIIIVSVNR